MTNSTDSRRRGIILFNLGGPETLSDVRPFLYNLFSDPDIIRIRNNFLRKTIAALIVLVRQRKSRDLYRQIGGGSPLRRITEQQAASLARWLEERGSPAKVYVGMRCWRPTIEDAVDRLSADGVTQVVALPLFPQFSLTTTGSCFNHLKRVLDGTSLPRRIEVTYVKEWFDEPLYLEAVADTIREAMGRFSVRDAKEIHLLYSAHSIPSRYLDEGDPYLAQTERSVELINERLGNASPSTLAFQSKVGPVKWLGPATPDVLAQFGRSGKKRVLIIPISFVSDHIETLQEIDILYRRQAAEVGIEEFHRAASLNLHPVFIDALGELSLRAFSTPLHAVEASS